MRLDTLSAHGGLRVRAVRDAMLQTPKPKTNTTEAFFLVLLSVLTKQFISMVASGDSNLVGLSHADARLEAGKFVIAFGLVYIISECGGSFGFISNLCEGSVGHSINIIQRWCGSVFGK